MKVKIHDTILKAGTINCPTCKEKLHFKQIHGMRLIENDLLEAMCPKDNIYFSVKTKK